MNWRQSDARSASKVEAYAIYSTLNLYNNFTYFLDDPTTATVPAKATSARSWD